MHFWSDLALKIWVLVFKVNISLKEVEFSSSYSFGIEFSIVQYVASYLISDCEKVLNV